MARTKYSTRYNPGSCVDERGKCKNFDKCWIRKDGGTKFNGRPTDEKGRPTVKCREPAEA